MSMRLKAIILVLGFVGLLSIPFIVHAGSGNFFQGDPIPDFNDAAVADSGSATEATETTTAVEAQYDAAAAQYPNCPPEILAGSAGLSAAQEQYALNLPLPELNPAGLQMPISIDDMRNHMNVLQQEGRTTDQCLACHTNREEFCDRCHNYSGVSPQFD